MAGHTRSARRIVDPARRVLERHWSARAALVLVVAIPAIAAIERGHVVPGVVAMVVIVAGLIGVVSFAPDRSLARLERRAQRVVPADDGEVVLIGSIVSARDRLVAPHSSEACGAYWARTLIENEGGLATLDESTAAVDFVLRCGAELVAVDTSRASIVFDSARRTFERRTTGSAVEEAVAAIGAQVLVSGHITHGPGEGPFRTAARIGPAGRRGVVIGLVERRT